MNEYYTDKVKQVIGKQIRSVKEVRGNIKAVCEWMGDALAISFDDGRFCIFAITSWSDGSHNIEIKTQFEQSDVGILTRIELLTVDELNEQEKFCKHQRAHEHSQEEYKMYLALKEKYEIKNVH